jgi:hypothetical protein
MRSARREMLVVVAAGLAPGFIAFATWQADKKSPSPREKVLALFDGKSLAGWKTSDYGGHGEIYVEDGAIVLEMGEPFTGITCTRAVPRTNYQITLEAKRVAGHDFFCGLTFPVGESCCTLIVGGWGGGLVGLSSLDGLDASQNETGKWMDFESKRWYQIRVRVSDDRIGAWIDKDKVIDVEVAGRKIGIRPDVEPSRPFGIATWRTTAALRNINLRSMLSAPSKPSAPKQP